MGSKHQRGLFDFGDRICEIGAKDPLARLHEVVDWEAFRAPIENAVAAEPKRPGGRARFDRIIMFKNPRLQRLHHRGRRSWWDRRPERYQPMSEYVYGNGDRVVSRNEFDPDYWHPRWESATYYHQDVLGSTSLMTNERGHTVERYTYDAFGVQTDGSFERVNEIGYTGQRYDPTTNMYNYGFRDYAPSIGRFTTVDPIRDGNNWYAYVNNDPVNFVDPLGLESADAAIQLGTELCGCARFP